MHAVEESDVQEVRIAPTLTSWPEAILGRSDLG